jgi:hypothetical protein
MGEPFNVYCDESCHLERDGCSLMMLGAVWCKTEIVPHVSKRLREIKARYGMKRPFEIKWTKVSPSKQEMYLDWVDYFFDDDDLHFRGYLIEKTGLDHSAYLQTHNDWYYKMCFRMLEPIIDPTQTYNIYLDIKDTRGEQKRRKLEEVLRSSRFDASDKIIHRVQQIRSHESELMQLADLLLGAVIHHNRFGAGGSPAKREIIKRIQRRSNKSLAASTWLREPKFNLFRWHPAGGE